MTPASLKALLEKYLEENISEEEFLELWKTLRDRQHDEQWFGVIDKALENDVLHQLSDPESAKKALIEIKAKLNLQPTAAVRRMSWLSWKWAAAVLVIAGASLFGFLYEENKQDAPKVGLAQNNETIQPDRKRVSLTLADGITIDPDSLENGIVVNLGKAKLVKLANGQLKYDPLVTDRTGEAMVTYNTMTTPAGKQYQLILPDGSRVWLNAQTTLVYPVVFSGKKRKVKVSGEAYFEVTHDKTRPFEVEAGDIAIEVVGTHFNVNAYPNENGVKTTLLEGKVKINNSILRPGQAYENGRLFKTDVQQDVSWKEGIFNFNNQHFAQVMRTLARWYDLDVEYPNGVPHKEYEGEMGINLSLTQVLKALEDSGLKFKLEGRRLIVQP